MPVEGKALFVSARYQRAHWWINRHFPRTGRCEYCGRTNRKTEYATTRPGVYTQNRADWFEFCKPCHMRFDGHAHGPNFGGKVSATAEWRLAQSKAQRGRPWTAAQRAAYDRRKSTASNEVRQ